jgi:hypothetical protein
MVEHIGDRMNPAENQLLTIVAESALERSLITDLDRLGVGGYTITDARGRGSRGRRSSGWEHTGNIRVEILCDSEMATRIMGLLREQYARDFAMTTWLQDVTRG